jgi:SAM-dependent methyltransferase
MTSGLQFDKAAAEQLLAVYVTPDVVAQRQQVVEALRLQTGERVLDVGSGPGLLASAMADRVGATGQVTGVDISAPLLAMSAAHGAHQPWLAFRHGDATSLPFPDGQFDVAVVTQVLEYVRDVQTALAELARVVRPGGRVFILDTDWGSLVWHSSDRSRMARILSAWDEHLADPHLPRTLAPRLRSVGLRVDWQQILPLFNPGFELESYSGRMIDLIAGFVTSRGRIEPAEAAAWAQDLRDLGAQGQYFFSLNRYLFGASRA